MKALLSQDKALVNAENEDGWTPLLEATLHGQVDVVRLLLEQRAEVAHQASDGSFARELAGTLEHTTLITLLEQATIEQGQ